MYVIYGIDNCKYCISAKGLLDKYNFSYEYHDVTDNKTEFLNNKSSDINNQRTFPVIFKDNIFIGGYTKLQNEIIFTVDEDF